MRGGSKPDKLTYLVNVSVNLLQNESDRCCTITLSSATGKSNEEFSAAWSCISYDLLLEIYAKRSLSSLCVKFTNEDSSTSPPTTVETFCRYRLFSSWGSFIFCSLAFTWGCGYSMTSCSWGDICGSVYAYSWDSISTWGRGCNRGCGWGSSCSICWPETAVNFTSLAFSAFSVLSIRFYVRLARRPSIYFIVMLLAILYLAVLIWCPSFLSPDLSSSESSDDICSRPSPLLSVLTLAS